MESNLLDRFGTLGQVTMYFCLGLFIVSPLMGWTYTYDTDTPLGSDSPSVIDDRIREVKDGVQERMNVDHYWPLTGTEVSDAAAGQHRQIEFYGPISTPTYAADKAWVYSKDVSSVVEIHILDESGNEIQLTDAGTINIASADLLGTVANDTYFTAVDNAGTGTADLIKADTNDMAVLPYGAELASSTAPVGDAKIACKKYVDDNVGSANWTPTSYAGEESITFPNGLIMKQGADTISGSGTTTVTFAAAFPTACTRVVGQDSSTHNTSCYEMKARTLTASSFKVRNDSSVSRTFSWFAIGY